VVEHAIWLCTLGFCTGMENYELASKTLSADEGPFNVYGRVSGSTSWVCATTQPGVGGWRVARLCVARRCFTSTKKHPHHFATYCGRHFRCRFPPTYSLSPFVGLHSVSPTPELCCSVHRNSYLLELVVLAKLAQTPLVHPITIPHTFHSSHTFLGDV
jgi:hypothetical protein